ncbi:hypothetical protein BET03_05185 [Thermohalobacter berrensis]|uniref:VanZ-like domain-containing protein n=2 Tax=Thermohalobacter berrensis TaxID=99594 RepID=A0A419SXY1_9FIRM|nr:hypothetical protein BET03_05185 [Thermohalobacter berrensis]
MYLLLLIKVIILKYPIKAIIEAIEQTNIENFKRRILYSNFIPMKTIFYYLISEDNIKISKLNIGANIIAFIPLGFILPFLIERLKKLSKIFIIAFIISLIFELIQLITGIGVFDVDDLILNVLGAILGFGIYNMIKSLIIRKLN